MADNHYQVVIIGSGPAGLTAAIYTSRANLKTLVVEGYGSGGQLMITTEVENFPGFPDGVTGPELMERVRNQAEKFGATLRQEDVTKVELTDGRPFKIWIEDELIFADSVIVATGAVARWLGLESEEKLRGLGVSACATCDGAFFQGKEVCVVGGGDTAVEDASYLTHYATKVYLIHRRDELRASKIMQKRVFESDKITPVWNSTVEEILGSREEGVTGVRLKNTKTGETSELPLQAVFVAIGHDPATELFVDQLDMDDEKYLIAKPGSTYTNIEGVFTAGDVQDKVYRQAISAAGSGCMSAIDCERWLESQND